MNGRICVVALMAGLCGGVRAEDLKALDFSSFEKVVQPESVDLHAFENPDFDDHSKFGTFDGGKLEIGTHWGFNGNAGAKITPFAKPYQFRPKLRDGVRLEKGRRYLFRLDSTGNGTTEHQIACDVYSRKTGKYLHGFWGSKTEPLGAGWKRSSLQVVPKDDPEDLDYRFMMYVAPSRKEDVDVNSPEHYVRVDNAAIVADAPTWYFANVWPTHFKVFNDDGNLRCHSSFVGPYLPAGADTAYELKLVAPDGTVVARDVVRPGANGALTAHFGKFAYAGKVDLVATLADLRGRKTYGSRTIALTATETFRPKPGQIHVPENGVPVVDGKPFMPIGFYAGFADAKKYPKEELEGHLRKLHDAGFNLIMDYSTYKLKTPEERKWYYDLCWKHGIRVLNDDFKYTKWDDFADRVEKARPRMRELATYPAVIGFYTLDEGTEDKVPMLEMLRRALNEEAPGCVVNTCNIFSPEAFLLAADIAGGDKYPIDNHPSDSLEGMAEYCRHLQDTTAVGWHAPQCYNWANSRRGSMDSPEAYRKAGREPNENEMLSVALTYASYGVKGFIFYSYFDMYKCAVPEWIPLRWANICKVAERLRDLEPFIMSGRRILEIPVTDVKGRTRVVAMTDGQGPSRVIAIGLTRDNEARFTLDPRLGKPEPCYGFVRKDGEGYAFSGKEFTCDILK